MTRALANTLTFILCVALVVTAFFCALVLDAHGVRSPLLDAQARTPLATEADKALSPLMVSTDGSTVTFRGVAPNALRICVEPAANTFGPRRCFTVGDVRDGLVTKR